MFPLKSRRELFTIGGAALAASCEVPVPQNNDCHEGQRLSGVIVYGASFDELIPIQRSIYGGSIQLGGRLSRRPLRFLCTSSDGESIAFFKPFFGAPDSPYVPPELIVAVPKSGKITRCKTGISDPTASALWSADGRLFVVCSRPDPTNQYRNELSHYLVSIDVETGLEILLTERLDQNHIPTRLTALSDDGLAYCTEEGVVKMPSSIGSSLDAVQAVELTISPSLSHFSWVNGQGELWLSDMKGKEKRIVAKAALGAAIWAPDSSGLCYVNNISKVEPKFPFTNPVEFQALKSPEKCTLGHIPMGNGGGMIGWLNCSIDVCRQFFQSVKL